MTQAAPPLQDGEQIVHDHIPSMGVFRRAAAFLILVSLLPTIAFAVVFEDSYWVIAPMFVTCMLLLQERFTMGRHRAWITNRRIILQNAEVPLAAVSSATPKSVYVQVRHAGAGAKLPLYYPKDGPALAQAIQTATRGNTDAE